MGADSSAPGAFTGTEIIWTNLRTEPIYFFALRMPNHSSAFLLASHKSYNITL